MINNYYEFLDDLLNSNYIEAETDNNCIINSIKKIIDIDMEKHVLLLLISINNPLKRIYSCYFK